MKAEYVNDARIYTLMGAIRGPDMCRDAYLTYLKTSLTGRIRAALFEKHECGLAVYEESPYTMKCVEDLLERTIYELTMKQTRYTADELIWHRNLSDHFLQHVIDALEVMPSCPIFPSPAGIAHTLYILRFFLNSMWPSDIKMEAVRTFHEKATQAIKQGTGREKMMNSSTTI